MENEPRHRHRPELKDLDPERPRFGERALPREREKPFHSAAHALEGPAPPGALGDGETEPAGCGEPQDRGEGKLEPRVREHVRLAEVEQEPREAPCRERPHRRSANPRSAYRGPQACAAYRDRRHADEGPGAPKRDRRDP